MARDPGEMVLMGRVLAPWGVQGWVKVEPYSAERDTLCRFPSWWIRKRDALQRVSVVECKVHSAHVVARFEGCGDRGQADAYRGAEVVLGRHELPPAGPDEFYQADLIGLEVQGSRGEALGRVVEILDQPAHPVLRVVGEGKERLLPLVPTVVLRVDLEAGVMEVDWGADW